MDIRNFFFKYRSYTPIPIGVMIVYFARPENAFLPFGLSLLLIGEFIRIWAVSYAGGETRTRNVGAPALCSSGPYAFVRNPLYVGNMFMYVGIVMMAGAANVWLMAATTFSFFLIQYSLIISLEEETLDKLFGPEYLDFKANVPAIFPRLSPWNSPDTRKRSGIMKTIKTEKRTLQNVSFILILISLRIQFFS
ncbi:MAG: isoprenylcysteine carboxylmethyltransferase family protein [Candidatus Marinimicrobia bacterium]|jgi:protein-S-isoprenylcysteine O-methyltransferase Ste14|nr:isoprenylcysteine carboxylmethyltransferase family protein [Candidatus Neomarinimicrobiota bacterium]MBT3675746.1 isoprenylcysteine carboxylmethyltransferase family protein [Candidatus Neomarinimicrobiota bacterium]MBT4067972.1 isoprenylcysteine carboxylmethyltransferase family protein [Candidatus Neomarinimicrobiota bacterium]MBT4308303.1 isoprenylcysteine carboxylmethyltransferase family protein [Candidatus Neomarinimicrobiota bacterium]MBT5175909.1 isoprenylcysteine carboxylmethyltransfer